MRRILLRPKAIVGLRRAPRKYQLRISRALNLLEQESFPLHTKKLGGVSHGYRTRIGQWRILFTLKNGGIDVADIFLKKGRGDYRRQGL